MAAGDRSDRSDRRDRVFAALGQFDDPGRLTEACRRLRDEGFEHWDAHAPFPVHGLERAMGLGTSRVPWFVFVLGIGGALVGMAMQWWVSVEGYPLVISGKPLFSWPAFVPIMFECGVLGGALGAVIGLLTEARLPRHHHGLFASERFERFSDDAFFVSIEATDRLFDAEKTGRLLRELGASHVELVPAEPEPEAAEPEPEAADEAAGAAAAEPEGARG